MATQNVLPCHAFDLIVDDYQSIKNYIENVFDDGDLSETESESSCEEESCHEKDYLALPKDVELANVTSGADANFSPPNKNYDKSSSVKICSPSNEKQLLATKNEHLHKITSPLLEQLQPSLESITQSLTTRQSHPVDEDVTKLSNKENRSTTEDTHISISPKSVTEQERSSDCSSGERRKSVSSHSLSKRGSNSSKSSSTQSSNLGSTDSIFKSHKRKFFSPEKSSKKFKDDHPSAIPRNSSRSQTNMSSFSKERDVTGFEKAKELSSGSLGVISSINQFKEKFKDFESAIRQSYLTDDINMNINKDGDEELLVDEINIQDNSMNIAHKTIDILSPILRVSSEHNQNIDHHVREDSSFSKEMIGDCTLEQDKTIIKEALDVSSLNLWDIDPLLINSIPTDEDILISHEKATDFRKFAPSSRFKLSDTLSDKTGIDSFDEQEILLANLENYDSDVCNKKCVPDVMLLQKAIKSLKTFGDISFCCSLLLKQSQKLHFKVDPEFCNSNLKMFIDKLHDLSEIQVESEDIESGRSITSCNKFGKRLINEPRSSTSDSQNTDDSDELHLVKQQIKVILNPAILNNEISKEDYEEIVRLVVIEVGRHGKKLHKFDCISFLEKSLQAIKRKRLF